LNEISHSTIKKKIAVFASGKGTNAENLIKHFKNHSKAQVTLVLTNSPTAEVIERANNLSVEVVVFDKAHLNDSMVVLNKLKKAQVDWIVLAGFLLRFPTLIIEEFPNRIVNIHPALLPKYGGKGMYGMNVHKAVVENHENETGITIHFVNENYDEGKIIFQAKTEVLATDTPEKVALKIHILEQQHFPKVIENLIAEKPQDTRLRGHM
jgi:phosphoribosylglycinamide formyltransferase 1